MEAPRIIEGSGWTHEGGRFAGYAAGHAATVYHELGMRAKGARTNENDSARLNPARAAERLAALFSARLELGSRRALPMPVDANIGSDRPLFDLFAGSRERTAAGLPV